MAASGNGDELVRDAHLLQRLLQPNGMIVGDERILIAVDRNHRRHTGAHVRNGDAAFATSARFG